MGTTQTIVLVAHSIIALLVIALVMLQRGKGADAGAGFGAGASGTVFGTRGSASFFSRATAVLATVFFLTSLGPEYFAMQRQVDPGSLLEGSVMEAVEDAPVDDASALPVVDDAAAEATADDLPAVEEVPAADEGPTEQ